MHGHMTHALFLENLAQQQYSSFHTLSVASGVIKKVFDAYGWRFAHTETSQTVCVEHPSGSGCPHQRASGYLHTHAVIDSPSLMKKPIG